MGISHLGRLRLEILDMQAMNSDLPDLPDLPDLEFEVDRYKDGVTGERLGSLLLFTLIIIGSVAAFTLLGILISEWAVL